MRTPRFCFALFCLVTTSAAHAQQLQQPPRARRADTFLTFHGERVPDPYAWMEDANAPETRAWAIAQDSFARAWVAGPERASLRARLHELAGTRPLSPPIVRNGMYVTTRYGSTGGAANLTLLVRRSADEADREIPLTDDAARRPIRSLTMATRAPRAVFSTARDGGNWQTWGFVDLESGKLLPDTLHDVHAASAAAWGDGDRVLYYSRFRTPPHDSMATARLTALGIYRHRLGTPQAEDERVYAAPRADCVIVPHAAESSATLVVHQTCGGTETSILTVSPTGETAVAASGTAAYTYAGTADDAFYWSTSDGAPNWKVVSLRVDGSHPRWTTLIPEDTLPIFSWGGGLGVDLVGSHLLVAYQRHALAYVRAFDLRGRHVRDIELPQLGSIWSGFVGDASSDIAFYSVSGVATPGTIYRLDMSTGVSTLWSKPNIALPLDSILTEQVFVTSKDGTRFPMFVVRKRDTPLDGTAPAWIYGYGFNDWTASPWFQSYVAEFINTGGIWALPNIRGGGEYGEAWNAAGSREQKMNTVDDYIAASEFLIAHDYTAARRIIANASSAGGIVAAIAVLQRPELYGAAILDYPALDMLRYHEYTVGPTWIGEYGTAEDPAHYPTLRRLSAPHNVRAGVCYPPIFVAPGERDQTTPPFHAYKFVAELQHAKGCSTHPVLLRVSWNAGHNAGSTRDEQVDNWADQLMFVRKALQPTRHISLGTLPEVEARGTGTTPMVLIPCASCRWKSFEPFMTRNADRYRMFAVTLPGYGGARPPRLPFREEGGAWTDNAVNAVVALIEREQLSGVVVAGHSYGAQIAVEVANRLPARVAAVINLDGGITNPVGWDSMSVGERTELARGALLQYGENRLFDAEQWQVFNMTRLADPERAKLYHGWFMATPRDVVMQYWREGIIRDLNAAFRAVRQPLLDVKAIAPRIENQDSAIAAHAARITAVGAPLGYERVVLARTTHFFIEENAADAMVHAFIERVRRAHLRTSR